MKNLKEKAPLHLFLLVLAAFLSATTVVLACIPLFLLRSTAGRMAYILYSAFGLSALALTQNFSLIVPVACSVLLVAFFEEARKLTCNLYQAGLASILSVSGLFSLSLAAFIHFSKIDFSLYLQEKMNLLLSSVKEMQPDVTFNLDKVVLQLPSAVVMIFMISLWLGLLGRSFAIKKYKSLKTYVDKEELSSLEKLKIADFSLPEQMIWLALPVLAVAFIDIQMSGLQVVASNLLNVIIVLYFFQGLSIVSFFFKENKIGTFWKWFWYIILVIHMFLLVSSLGFADYWMDFKSKIRKKPAKAA